MKLGRTFKTVAAAAALVAGLAGLGSATTAKLGTASKLWLEGKSTLHPYESVATKLDVSLELDKPGALDADIKEHAPAKLTLKVPVDGLKSPHGGLDKNLRKTLNSDKNPDIVFVMKDYKLGKDAKGGETIAADGDLTIAGQTKPETINASLSYKDGAAVLDGEQPLLMSDFGVKAPTMMMGTIKTDDKVVVKFHLILEPAADEPKGEKK